MGGAGRFAPTRPRMVPWMQKMAEGNANRPAPETLSTEDVERLSERFKPSWEPDTATAPRAEPGSALKQTMVGGTAPAAPLAPSRPAAPTPAPAVSAPPAAASAPRASIPTATPAPVGTPIAPQPMTTVTAGKSGLEVAKGVRHPTLVGIAPHAVRQVSGAPRAAPDDLDWELPPGEQPEPPQNLARTAPLAKAPDAVLPPKAEASRIQPVGSPPVTQSPAPAEAPTADDPIGITVDVDVELPPESKPSGIGQKYVPPDQNAPPIVLDDEVARLEAQTRATLEAQHRARSAPTIARMPAVRVAAPASGSDIADLTDEDTISHRRKSRKGVWVLLALLTLGGGTAAAVALLKKPDVPTTTRPETPAAAVDTVAPPPPAATVEPPPPALEPTTTAPAPAVASVAPASAEPPQEPARVTAAAPPVRPPVEAAKRTPAPAARPPKPKPASTGKSNTGSASRPPRAAVIVRDNPF
jgi:hypothetical protein